MLHKSGRIDEDVTHRIKAAWLKPAILYGSECWPITKALANRMEVAELRMLRWTCGKTMLDMIPNGVYRAELEVETIINKMREGRLRWFGHVRRRPQSAPVRRVEHWMSMAGGEGIDQNLDMCRRLCDGGEPRQLRLKEKVSGDGWIRMSAAAESGRRWAILFRFIFLIGWSPVSFNDIILVDVDTTTFAITSKD
ncbi:hypothetical protein Tco_1344692 [Tanacetum coccineum]